MVEKYLWANLTTLLAIYDKDDNLIQRFEYADQRVPISMTSNGQKYYLHYDQVGTLKAVTDTTHNIIKEISYDTYGNILSDSNPSFKVPFGFAGGLYDEDTKLTRFGYRDYDAYTAKWTAKDPIDFGGGDSNLYGYVLGDPVNFVDPSGEFSVLGGLVAGFIGGAIVGIVDGALNARCASEFLDILLVDTASGVLGGILATGGGVFGAILGEVGGLRLNALSGLNSVPIGNPCDDTPPCK